MEDLRQAFVTVRKDVLKELQNQVERLSHEREKLIAENRLIKLQNQRLTKLMPKVNLTEEVSPKLVTADNKSTFDFIQRQGYSNINLNTCHSPSPPLDIDTHGIVGQNSVISNQFSDNGFIANQSPNTSPIIGYGVNRNFTTVSNHKHEPQPQQSDRNLNDKQKIRNSSIWSLSDNMNTKCFTLLSKEMRNTDNPSILLKTILREWTLKPNDMTRIEFFFNLIAILIENGVYVRYCSEHSPPCKPTVNTKMFEKSAQVLSEFIKCINKFKQTIIEVELLAAVENFIYFRPKFRPAMSDIMDILYRKGVVEAAAFSEWSEIEVQSPERKKLLINEIKSSGFSLIKRSSSL